MKSEGGAKMSEALHGRVRVLEELLQSKEQAVLDQAAKLELMLAQSQIQASLLRALVAATDPSHQGDFFHAVVYHLAAALNLAYAVIGEIGAKGKSAGRVETNAVWANGDFAPNFTYDLLGMPCAHLLQERFFYCEEGVQQRFPQAQLMRDLGVEGYCEVQIFSSSHTLIGVLALLDTKPLHLSPEVLSLLTLFASRIGSEFDRCRAEQAREKAMRDLQNIMDTVPDLLFTLDLEGNLTQWNSQVRKVTGYSSEELVEKPALAFVPIEEGERTAAAIRQALTSGYAELEGHLLTKDGRVIPFHWTGAALKDVKGQVIGISGVGRDVSEQRWAQEEEARQRRQLVAAQALAHLGSWDWDIDSGDVEWSDEKFRIFGHEPGAIPVTYDTMLASLLPDDHDRVLAGLNDALLGKRPYDIEYRIVRPSGQLRTVHSRGEVIRDATGHPIRMAGATLDITERKQVEEALRMSEERWQLAVQGSNDGIWDWKIRTGEVFYSSRWKVMRGYEDHEITSHVDEWRSRIHPDDLDRVLTSVDAYLAKNASEFCEEYRVQRKDGSYMWILDRGVALWADDGTALRMTGSESDITDRKRAEEALRASEELFAKAFRASPNPIGITDMETGRCIDVNDACLSLFGYRREEVIGQTTLLLGIWPNLEDREQLIERLRTGGPVRNLEMSFRIRSGELHHVLVSSDLVELNGRCCLVTVGSDITERKRTEEALQQSERELRTVLDTLPVGVWFTDISGKVILSNPAGQRIWAGSAGIGIETNEHREEWREKAQAGVEPHRWALTRALLQGEMSLNETMEIECQNGARKLINNSAVPVKNDRGHVVGAIIVNEDITERKRAEEIHAKLAAIVTSSYDAIISLSLDGCIQSWNMGAEVMFGYATDETIGESVAVLFPDGRGADVSVAIRRAAEGAPVYHLDTCLRRKNGESVFVSLNMSPIVPQDGMISLISLIARDVTDQKHAEEALRMSEELFAKAFRCSPYPMVLSELDSGRCLDANEAAIALFGYSREEVAGRTSHDLELWQTPEDRSRFIQHLRQAGSIRNCDVMLRDKFGRMRQCLVSAELVELHGKPCIIKVGHDITEQKRAEEELRQSHALIRQIIDVNPNFIFAKDREGRFTLVNKAVADYYGTTVEELIGKSDADFNLNCEEVEFFRRKDLEVMDTLLERFIPEEIITDAAGRRRWLQTVKRPILDEQGHAVMVLGAATDITERKQIEEELRRHQRDLHVALDERERICQDLHDGILQSLYAVALGLEACKPMLTNDPARVLDPFQRAVAQLNTVMGEVRGFIAGMDSKPLDTVDLTAALRLIVESITQARTMKVRLALNRQAVGSISRDKAIQLLNVVKEAVSNSLRHGHARHATVSLTKLKQSVRLAIRDDGMGFNPNQTKKGCGLDNMASRAAKMGGRFTVVSKPKSGTRIIVDLPVEAPYAHA